MKTTSNKYLQKSLFALIVTMGMFQLASAQAVFNFFGSDEYSTISAEVITDKKTKDTTDDIKKDNSKNSCEYFDSTTLNVLNLESSSADIKQKIENVEDTIDNESVFRDTILSSVKGFLGLQKTDKVIFKEMKKDINNAKDYYADLDDQLLAIENFLAENTCEDVDLNQAIKIDDNTNDLVQEEGTFRKQFVATLKEKMKILQESLEQAKK